MLGWISRGRIAAYRHRVFTQLCGTEDEALASTGHNFCYYLAPPCTCELIGYTK